MPSYTSKFSMPVIGPPPTGTDPTTYYAGVLAASTVSATGVTHQGLQISLSNHAYRGLYSMSAGLVTFIPPGDPLPTTPVETSPGAGSLVLTTWAVDVTALKKGLPPGVPPWTIALYLNVQPATVRTALDPLVRAQPLKLLQAAYDLPGPESDPNILANRFLDNLLLGKTAVFVPSGGTPLGDAELAVPANTGSDVQFTLRFLDGAGMDLSPILHVRSMPTYGGVEWTDHPLIAAVAGVVVPADFFAKFEVWNITTHNYDALSAGVSVDLMDYDLLSPNDVRATQATDGQGVVHFTFPDMATFATDNDLFFRVQTNGMNFANSTLPAEWSTKGWTATDGSPGYYPNFSGTRLGDAATPLTFRIGLDFHALLEYADARSPGKMWPAPKGIKLTLETAGLLGPPGAPKVDLRTNDNGEVHGILFDVAGGDHVYYHIEFEIEDTTINLPRARVQMDLAGWSTFWADADVKSYPDNDQTSLGTFATPDHLTCTINDRNYALFLLKTLRELSVFLFHLTGGAWTGVTDLTYFRSSISGIPYSWPVGEVNIPPTWSGVTWDRGTIIHETSHQLMWKEVNFGTLGIIYQAIFNLRLYHEVDLLANPRHALIEGWADFMEELFEPSGGRPYSVALVTPTYGVPATVNIGPPPLNQGESVEGAFANGLWQIVTKHVGAGSAGVPESPNGDVTITAPWLLSASAQTNFLAMIWNPLKAIRTTLSTPGTTDMLDEIRKGNLSDWHTLRPELQNWNMAMVVPTIGSLTPATGPAAGGTTVTITGTEFVSGATVTFAGTPATSVTVNSSTSLDAVAPAHAAGAVDIRITTKAGSVNAPAAFTYT